MRISNIQPINYVSNLNFRGRIDTRPNYDTYDSFTGLKGNAGEFLKQGKSSLKGRAYTMEVE